MTEPATTTSLLTLLALVPPADPSSLIGSTISTKLILPIPGSVPESAMQVPTVLINGGDTNLASYGDACVDNDCEHAVELLADRHTFVNGPSAGASYLVLESFFERDSDGRAIWTISDVIAIADLPIDNPVTLLAEGCTLVNLPEGITAVATLRDWNSDPVTPTRVWGLADTTGALVEVSVDPAWTCEWQGD